MIKFYPALIDSDLIENVVTKKHFYNYGVTFPDFPGCVSAHTNIHRLADDAKEALGGHVALMVEDGDDIPEPCTVEYLGELYENEFSAVIMVPVEVPE